MEYVKSSLKQVLEVVTVDGQNYPVEMLEGAFKVEIGPRDTIEAMRADLHEWVDRKFNDLITADVGKMAERIEEAAQLSLKGFFDRPDTVSSAVRGFIEASAKFDGDVTLSSGGKTVKVPKP